MLKQEQPTPKSDEIEDAHAHVGGVWIPVNKLELLVPYISLAILLAAAVVTVGYVKKRRKRTRINS